MIDRKPALMAKWADVADFIAALRFGRENGLRVALRGGGQNAVLQSIFDGLYTPGFQWYWKADFFEELGDRAIVLHAKHCSQLPTLHSTMHLYPINGAAHRRTSQALRWLRVPLSSFPAGVWPNRRSG
jgi:hypothetical protein